MAGKSITRTEPESARRMSLASQLRSIAKQVESGALGEVEHLGVVLIAGDGSGWVTGTHVKVTIQMKAALARYSELLAKNGKQTSWCARSPHPPR